MNCGNCKHWVFTKCSITGNNITADKICNAWELSVSFDQAQKSNSAPENATELLKDHIAELKDFIDQLIKLGDAVISALCVYDAEKDTREVCDWDLFTYAWKTSASKKQPATENEELENVDMGREFAEITFKDGRTVDFFLSKVPDGEWRLWDASKWFCVDSEDLHAIVDKLDELNGVKE